MATEEREETRNADVMKLMHVSTSYSNRVTSLHVASATRDSCIIKWMLENKADPNTRDAKGNTPLHYVMMSNNKQSKEVIDVLLEYGADAELENEYGDSPLMFAISSDSSYAVGRFLEQKYGVEIDLGDEAGSSALHFACTRGNLDMAKFLLENDFDVNKKSESGKTPLHFAYLNLKDREILGEMVDLLMQYGADVMGVDDDRESLHHCVSMEGNVCSENRLFHTRADFHERNADGDFVDLLTGHEVDVNTVHKNGRDTCGYTSFHHALVSLKDPEALRMEIARLIKTGEDLNAVDGDGDTALHCTLKGVADGEARERIVTLLVENGADGNVANGDGDTTLHCIFKYVEVQEAVERMVFFLINKGASFDMIDNNGDTILHCTLQYIRNTEILERIVKMLIVKGADVNVVNVNGDTALHCTLKGVADEEARERIVTLLVENGADVNVANGDGDTTLHCIFKYVEVQEAVERMVFFLINKGASFDMIDNNGDTILHCTLQYIRNTEILERIVKMLIAKGADVNTVNGDGDTALHSAFKCVEDHETLERVVDLLIENGADFTIVGGDGDAALHCTFTSVRDLKTVERIAHLLVKKGADVNILDRDGNTPLYCAFTCIEKPKMLRRIVDLLIENGADVNNIEEEGGTALHCIFQHVKDQKELEGIVNRFIEKGVNVNIVDDNGDTALHFASYYGNAKIAQILLDHGADLNAVNERGNSPLHAAIQREHKAIVEILCEHGADVTKRDDYCKTAFTSLSALGEEESSAANITALIDKFVFPKNDEKSMSHGRRYKQELLFLATVKEFDQADDIAVGIAPLTQELINSTQNRMNFMLTWLTYYARSDDGATICQKLIFLLDHTEDFKKTTYHQRNFLHILTSSLCVIQAITEGLIDIIDKYVDASLCNSLDDYGWTPIHITFVAFNILSRSDDFNANPLFYNLYYKELIEISLKKGYKVDNTDIHGTSVIHYAAGTVLIDTLKVMLEHCTTDFMNEGDLYGSTPLHYAAFANNFKAAKLLLDKGCKKNSKDHKGRTAGDLALMLGYGDIIRLLCDSDGSPESGIFICRDIDKISQASDNMDYKQFTETLKRDAGENHVDAVYTSVLKSPVLGSLKYQEICFQEEAHMLRKEVDQLIERFSEQYGRRCPMLAFHPKLRGSMAEGTKCGPPDEFDFMLIMTNLSKHCRVDSIDNCKANITLMSLSSTRDDVDTGHLSPNDDELSGLLYIVMYEILRESSIWKESALKFVSCDRMGVGLCLTSVFSGHLYKSLHISIDLVPCIPLQIPVPVEVSCDWPLPLDFSHCQLYGLFRIGYNEFDLSSTDYEDVLMKSLPTAAIDAYILGKAFSSAHFKWSGKRLAKIFKKSYTMKKALFLSLQKHKDAQVISRHEWIEGIISVRTNLEKYVNENDCRRCIFHAADWVHGKNDCIHLSF